MNRKSILIAPLVTLFLFIGVPVLSQESPPDLTGIWVSHFTGTCFNTLEGGSQEKGKNWTLYIDDHGDGTFNATIPNSSKTVYFGKSASHLKDPDKGAVVFIKCNINDTLTVHRSALAWGEFDIKKEALDVVVVGYFTGNDPDPDPNIWEVCDYHDRYTRITTQIPSEVLPCQP